MKPGRSPALLDRVLQRAFHPEMADFSARAVGRMDEATKQHLQTRAETFVQGARLLLAEPDSPHVALASVPAGLRGFAYEGAATAAALRDLVQGTRPATLGRLRGGPGVRYRHLIHVGIGWGLSRARLSAAPPWWRLDPLLRWLGHNGAGFQRLFLADDRQRAELLSGRRPIRTLVDLIELQGMGRALWFLTGADLTTIDETTRRFPASARSALWAGVGLAAAYAGSPVVSVADLSARADRFPALRHGVVFGAAAHAAHGWVPPHTSAVALGVAGVSPDTCLAWADEVAGSLTVARGGPSAYLLWQSRLSDRVMTSRYACTALESA